MALAVTSNFSAVADNVLTRLNKHQSAMGKSIERVTTGLKINSAKDNVTKYVATQKMDLDVKASDVVSQNLQNGTSYLNAMDTALSSIFDMLTQLREKAAEYATGTASSIQESALQSAISSIASDIKSIVNSTSYNGKAIFSTAASQTLKYVDDPFEFHDSNKIEVTISSMSEDLLKDGNTSISNSSTALAALGSKGTISKAIEKIRYMQMDVGIGLARMENMKNYINDFAEATNDGISTIRDADMAKEMTAFVKASVMAQASQAMLSQTNAGIASVLNLLQ